MIQPIKPEDIIIKIDKVLYVIIEVFNNLIKENYHNGKALIKESEIVMAILRKTNINEFTGNDLHDKHWLNIEDMYREAGWIVEYYKPLSNEAIFIFRRRDS